MGTGQLHSHTPSPPLLGKSSSLPQRPATAMAADIHPAEGPLPSPPWPHPGLTEILMTFCQHFSTGRNKLLLCTHSLCSLTKVPSRHTEKEMLKPNFLFPLGCCSQIWAHCPRGGAGVSLLLGAPVEPGLGATFHPRDPSLPHW